MQTAGGTVKVIVQYKQVPQAAQEGRVHNMGAHLNHRLGVVKGLALTIPLSALPALEADPDVLSVSIDHPMKGLDDITDVATNVTAAWTAGYNGTGVGVAVIDSGINDSHLDLWNSTQTSFARGLSPGLSPAPRIRTRVGPSTTSTVTELTSPESSAATATSPAETTLELRPT